MPKTSTSSQKRSFLKTLLRIVAYGTLLSTLILGGVITYYIYDLPDIQNLAVNKRVPSIVFLSQDHREIASIGERQGNALTTNSVPPYLIEAITSTEDRKFYEHHGVNWRAILRAIWANIQHGRYAQGGSTITQQLAKNLFLSSNKSLRRKIQELILTYWLEHYFSKNQIMDIYLNRVYLGHGAIGFDAAAQIYFGKLTPHLTLEESAALVGLLKAPSRYSRSKKSFLKRAHVVINAMVNAGKLTSHDGKKAKEKLKALTFSDYKAQLQNYYFIDWLKEEIKSIVAHDQDLIVVTTLDPKLQKNASEKLESFIKTHHKKYNVHQGAFLSMNKSGAVTAMVGGVDYLTSSFNRAYQALRQVGSIYKIFVYGAAMDAGLSLSSLYSDMPINLQGWTPKNYGWQERGEVSLSDGFIYSINTVALRVAMATGLQKIINFSKSLSMPQPSSEDLSIVLGTSTGSLFNLVNAVAIISNEGKDITPYGVLEIWSQDGTVLYKRQPAPELQQVDPSTAQSLKNLMIQSVEKGTSKAARIESHITGGKTGTTQNFKDAWFVGFKDNITAGVWLGNDDESPMLKVVGGTLPARLWKSILTL